MVEVKVPYNSDGVKLLKFVKSFLKEAPLSYIYKAFRKKDIKVNGHWEKEDFILHTNDLVRIYITDQQLEEFRLKRTTIIPSPLPYAIAYEDNNILVVDKPAGVLVMEDEERNPNTLTREVRSYLSYKGEYDSSSLFQPSPAHRLDRNTAGLVCYGKTDAGLKTLTSLFKERKEIEKHYYALVKGVANPLIGEIRAPLKKDEKRKFVEVTPIQKGGQEAITEYRTIEKFSGFSLIDCLLHTGRTHQLRVHLSYIHHPIIGDAKYGDYALNREVERLYHWPSSRQFLRARSLVFKNVDGVLSPLKGKTLFSRFSEEEEKVLFLLRSQKEEE